MMWQIYESISLFPSEQNQFNKIIFHCSLWMWELKHKEVWAPKNWCFRIVVLEKTLENPLDRKEIKPVNPKEIQHWIFIGRTDAEAPILWPHDALILGKTKGKRRREWQRMRWLDSITDLTDMKLSKFGEIVEDRSLECCSPWGRKKLDMI